MTNNQEKILIDFSIGHGPKEPGTTARHGGESVSEWQISHHRLRPALEEHVYKNSLPYRLRFWDPYDNPEWGEEKDRTGHNLLLLDRLRAMYDKQLPEKPEFSIALHNNASKNQAYGGTMVIYRREKNGLVDEYGKLMANCLQEALCDAFPDMKDRKIQADTGDWVERDLAFTRWGFAYEATPVIIEFGFLTHENDRQIILAKETPAKFAQAIFKGFAKYIEEE